VAREQRRHRQIQFFQGVVGVCPGQKMKGRGDAAKIRPTPLQRRDGVVETRRFRVRRDPLDAPAVLIEDAIERRTEVLRPDAVEWRQAEGRLPIRQQRIAVLACRSVVHQRNLMVAVAIGQEACFLRKISREFEQIFTLCSQPRRTLDSSKWRLPAAGAKSPALSGIAKGRVNVFTGSASSRRLPAFSCGEAAGT
jgi:hypothetical protein